MRRQELDAFIRFALKTLPQRTASTEEARAVLIAAGIITADGELAAEHRPAGDSGKLLFLPSPKMALPSLRARADLAPRALGQTARGTGKLLRARRPSRPARQAPPPFFSWFGISTWFVG
jgi:hypothetical protein